MLLYLLVKICRFYHQNSVFVVLMLMFLSMGKNILRIYFVCVFQFEMMKPTRTRTQNIELTLYGLIPKTPSFPFLCQVTLSNKNLKTDAIFV